MSSYHIIVLKRQNRFKVGTDKPKLKVKMQSVSDDDVQKRLLEKPRFELHFIGRFLSYLIICDSFKLTSDNLSHSEFLILHAYRKTSDRSPVLHKHQIQDTGRGSRQFVLIA